MNSTRWTLAAALLLGLGIGYVDSRPGWNDTGIIAGAVLAASTLLSVIAPRVALITGLAVGLPLFVMNAWLHGNLESAIAVGIALLGAALGRWIGRALGSGAAGGPTRRP
jgi:hypothetical protein